MASETMKSYAGGISILATGIIDGISEIVAGMHADVAARGASALAEVNAARLAQQADTIQIFKDLQAAADDRDMQFAMGRGVATTSGKGIEMSGSPMAIMVDTLSQMELNKAIGQYNLDVEKRRMETASALGRIEARGIRQSGKASRSAGYVKGANTISKGLLSAALSVKKPAGKTANVIMKRGDAPTKINIAGPGYWRTKTP